MYFLKSLISLIISLVMLASNTLIAKMPVDAPEPKSEAELYAMDDIIRNYPLSNEITVINRSEMTKAETYAAISLQGIVAKTSPSIFINFGGVSYENALSELKNAGYSLSYTNENGVKWNFSSLVEKFSSAISDNGYILYSTVDDHAQLNTATNYSTLFGWLAVPTEVEDTVKALGLTKKEDISDKKLSIGYQRDFYKKYKDEFRKDILIHQQCIVYGLRDLAIQQNIFVMYVDETDTFGKAFRDEVFTDLDSASLILGWCQYEIKFTERVSTFGHYVVPSDHSHNLSLLASFEAYDEGIGSDKVEAFEPDPTKHYITIMYSDGDNAQWVQNGYGEFHTWQSYEIDTPISWTFPPLLSQMSSVDVKRTAENLGNDSLITGPTGAGYARISHMSCKDLEAYSDLTASLMLKNKSTTLTVIDGINNGKIDESFKTKLGYFARYDNIHGAIMQLDPDRYTAGAGAVCFVNDKPFISVKLALWHPSGNADEVTNEWLRDQADIVNAYPADINSINGYSVINVHPWTVGPDDLAYFVSCLDEDIVVISGDEMIAALSQNIPHTDAKPE